MVIDASAVLTLLLQSPGAEEVAERLRAARGNVHAPHLLDVEVTQVLARVAAADPRRARRCRQALQDLCRMPIFRHSHDDLQEEAWELRGRRGTREAYYVALARRRSEALLACEEGRVISDASIVDLDR